MEAQDIPSVYSLRQRNSLAFISRLPPEILETIFIHCACDYHENSCSRQVGVAHWVGVSYVCHDWRNTALSCPTLWTYHFPVSLRWTEELLARSKQAPLKICLNDSGFTKVALLWEKLMDHVDRIQELQLVLSCPSTPLPTKFFLRAPHLQHLSINIHGYPARWSPALFDGGDTPALRRLHLMGCGAPWDSLTLSGLTTLILSYIPSGSRPSVVKFRAVLSRMQNLTALALHDALARTPLGLLSDELLPQITLPRLLCISVTALPSTAVAFLSCVGFPSRARIILGLRTRHSPADEFAPILPFLAQIFSISQDPVSSTSVNSLSVDFGMVNSRIQLTTSERTTQKWRSNNSLHILFRSDQRNDIVRIMSDVCCSLPLTNIRCLYICDPPFPSTFWEGILGHLRGLQRIELSKGNMPDLSSVLSLVAHEPAGNPDGRGASDCDLTQHVFVPALERLELHCITFSSDDSSEDAISQSALLDALSTREALQVTITECSGNSKSTLVDRGT